MDRSNIMKNLSKGLLGFGKPIRIKGINALCQTDEIMTFHHFFFKQTTLKFPK